jgi:hypothetical protein
LPYLLNIPCFYEDMIKEILGDGFGSENNVIELKGSFATFY